MPRVGVVILAAGRSTRYVGAEASKLVALVDGVPLVRRAVAAAIDADVGDVLVVTGDHADEVSAALAGLRVRVLREPSFAIGMSESLRCGVRAFRDADAIVIGLGDQPGVRAEAYRRVVSRWRTAPHCIVVPHYDGPMIPAHPTLFPAAMFGELLSLQGDAGARALISRDPSRVIVEPLEWPAPRDVDTLQDLERVRELAPATDIGATRPSPSAPLETEDSQ